MLLGTLSDGKSTSVLKSLGAIEDDMAKVTDAAVFQERLPEHLPNS